MTPLTVWRANTSKPWLFFGLLSLVLSATSRSSHGHAKPSSQSADQLIMSRTLLGLLVCENSTKKGAGLGLVISKTIVEAHGGKILVESEKEKGCTFFFFLPVTAVQNSLFV